jgi:hypothetical protein
VHGTGLTICCSWPGADVVIPEYRRHERLLRYLFAED